MRWLPYLVFFCIILHTTGCATGLGIKPKDFISRSTYQKLVIEVTAAKGCEPSKEALEDLTKFIGKYCEKPRGISLIIKPSVDVAATSSTLWTTAMLLDFESKHRKLFSYGDTLVLHISYVPGFNVDKPEEAGNEFIGLAFEVDSFFVFRERFSADTERLVLRHEMGHIFGLVGKNPLHEDRNHNYHCKNTCLMFWNLSGQIEDLDELCQADIRRLKE